MEQRWIMLLVLFLVRLAMGYQFQSVASISPQLARDLGLTYAEIGTLIGLFLLPGVFFAIPSGLVTRKFSNKNLLMAGAALMIVGAFVMTAGGGTRFLFAGRLVAGVGGTLFNVILTKMVTEWFFEKEIVTALAVMLTAWPIGISIGLVTQGAVASAWGWPWAIHATAALALVSLLLTAFVYRDAPPPPGASAPFRLGLPWREFVHMCVVGAAWALFNACIILMVSFMPDVFMSHGLEPERARRVTGFALWATLLSIPAGGRLMEKFGHITMTVTVSLALAAALIAALAQGMSPAALAIAFGLVLGVPAGALVALSSEAVTPVNRGPGLGIFYTGYYLGMTTFPSLGGALRDATGSAATPIHLAAGTLVATLLCVLLFRALQRAWPIAPTRIAS